MRYSKAMLCCVTPGAMSNLDSPKLPNPTEAACTRDLHRCSGGSVEKLFVALIPIGNIFLT